MKHVLRTRGQAVRQAVALVWAAIWIVTGSVYAQESDPDAILSDIQRLLPGTYTNEKQLSLAGEKTDAFALTTIIVPLTNPVLGETLYYLEEYRDNDPNDVTRIRIYAFTTEETGVRLRLLNPIDVPALHGAHADLARAEALTMDDIHSDRDVCMLDVSPYNGALVARMRYQACDIGDIYNDYEWTVDDAGSWTCYARRHLSDDSVAWRQMPAFPCIRQDKTRSAPS